MPDHSDIDKPQVISEYGRLISHAAQEVICACIHPPYSLEEPSTGRFRTSRWHDFEPLASLWYIREQLAAERVQSLQHAEEIIGTIPF